MGDRLLYCILKHRNIDYTNADYEITGSVSLIYPRPDRKSMVLMIFSDIVCTSMTIHPSFITSLILQSHLKRFSQPLVDTSAAVRFDFFFQLATDQMLQCF